MPVLPQTFFTFMGSHFMSLTLLSAWHFLFSLSGITYLTFALTLFTKVFAGLNEGILWAGIIRVVFFEIFLAVFFALFLIMKLPNPSGRHSC